MFMCGDNPISHLQLHLELLKVILSTYLRIVNLSRDLKLDICNIIKSRYNQQYKL